MTIVLATFHYNHSCEKKKKKKKKKNVISQFERTLGIPNLQFPDPPTDFGMRDTKSTITVLPRIVQHNRTATHE